MSHLRPRTGWPSSLSSTAYHGLGGEIVRTIEPHSEADPAALLIQVLTAFGNFVGRGPYFLAEADRHYTNLYAVLVGSTSKGRKGSSLNQVLRVLGLVDPEWVTDGKQTGLSSGEGLIWAVRDKIEREEPVRDAGPVTEYQSVVADPGVEDKRLLVVEPEFASTLRVMSRDGNNLSPVLRAAWDHGDLRTLTKNSPARTTGAHISIIGHITADEFRRYLDRTEAANGFMNRFLVICVRRSKVLPEGGNLTDEDLAPLAERLSAAIEFARSVEWITFDPDARALWHQVYPDLSEGKPGLHGAMTSRAEAQVIRLASLYALVDQSKVIQAPHLKAALALWAYAETSVALVFGNSTGDPLADELDQAIRARPGGMTRTDIRDHFKRHKSKDHIDRALTALAQLGRVSCVEEKTPGRSTQRWVATKATKATKAVLEKEFAPQRDDVADELVSLDGKPSVITHLLGIIRAKARRKMTKPV